MFPCQTQEKVSVCFSDKNDKVRKQSSTITKEPEPVPCVLQGDDIQVEDLKKVCIFIDRNGYLK